MPKNAAASDEQRVPALGRRTCAKGATASSASAATASRTTDRPMTPMSGAATRIAGNALAHVTTTARPAASTLNEVIGAGCLGGIRFVH